MSKYFRSRSMPTNCKPIRAQATPVVPLPMKGSQTVPFAFGALPSVHSISRSGFPLGGHSQLLPTGWQYALPQVLCWRLGLSTQSRSPPLSAPRFACPKPASTGWAAVRNSCRPKTQQARTLRLTATESQHRGGVRYPIPTISLNSALCAPGSALHLLRAKAVGRVGHHQSHRAAACGSNSRQSPCHSSQFPIVTFSAIITP
jgi:hypothetical protein